MTGLLLVHGRSQEMPARLRSDPRQVADHVAGLKRRWLGGLARGAASSNLPAPAPGDVELPFYGNLLADLVTAHEAAGGRRPNLESLGDDAEPVDDKARERFERADEVIGELQLQAAGRLGYVGAGATGDDGLEGLPDLMNLPGAVGVLQFLAVKTTTPQWIIEHYLRDVAHYVTNEEIRQPVLAVVRQGVRNLLDRGHTSVVVVGHSLGSVVAYDLCREMSVPVRLLVTAGSPLGFPAVLRNLPGLSRPPGVPSVGPSPDGRRWVNAFDPRDVVALIHPLAPVFAGGRTAIRDEVVANGDDPHSIVGYLSDPDVAAPVVRALAQDLA